MKNSIATIGYEGTTIDAFIGALKKNKIDILVDVRDLPMSRKKGFSKNQLAQLLQENNIQYVHLKGLGDPKEGRLAARAGNFRLFQRIFGRHMKTDVALRDADIAAELALASQVCLMCFECDHEHCHRSIVADCLADKTGLDVIALKVAAPSQIVRSNTPDKNYAYA